MREMDGEKTRRQRGTEIETGGKREEGRGEAKVDASKESKGAVGERKERKERGVGNESPRPAQLLVQRSAMTISAPLKEDGQLLQCLKI